MAQPRNIILLTVDSLRYDSVFGRNHNMPYVVNNAKKFNWARSSGCWTLPATTSMFTGKMPHEHGATSQSRGFRDDLPTLAEKLKGAGYNTYQATGNIVTTNIFGLDRGFDKVYRVWDHAESKYPLLLNMVLQAGKPRIRKRLLSKDFMFQRMSEDFRVGICWSQATYMNSFDFVRKRMQENEDKGEKSFFFINLMEAHYPYHVGDKFKLTANGLGGKYREAMGLFHTLNQTFLKKEKNPVNPETEKVLRERQFSGWDLLSKPVDDFIKEMHEDKDNLVILCADHGDNFGDQEWVYHFSNVTDGGNRVPLMWLDHEKRGAAEVNYPVSSRFMYNDILSAAGAPHDGGTLHEETPDNLPVLQSYWYNNNHETLDRYRYNQMCFIEGNQRFVYRDTVDKKFRWLQAPVDELIGGFKTEPNFEEVEATFDPIEEVVQDTARKEYLRRKVKEFKEFSDKIDRHPK